MMKHDVTKTPFSHKFIDGFFWSFGGRRHIDAGEGIESFASISAAVIELSRKSGREGRNSPPPPPSGASVNGLLELWVESHWLLINALEPQMYQVISLSKKAQVARRADGGEKGCLQVDWNWNKVCDWSFIKPPTKPRSQAQNSGRSKPKPKTAVKNITKPKPKPKPSKTEFNSQLTAGLFVAPPPLVFRVYLPKLRTDHRQIFNMYQAIDLTHHDERKTC